MLVYTCKAVDASAPKPPQFVQRGIEGNTQSPIGYCNVHGLPTEIVPTYGAYRYHIGHFVAATSIGHVITLDCYPGIKYKTEDLVDILTMPRIVFAAHSDFGTTKDEEKALRIDEKLSKYGAHHKQSGAFTKYTLDKAKWSALDKIKNTFATEARVASSQELNIYYYQSYHHLHQVLDLFLATHTYPCFATIDEADEDEEMDEGTKPWEEEIEVDESIVISGDQLGAYLDKVKTNETKNMKWLRAQPSIDLGVTSFTISADAAVPVAKPSPLPPSFNIGPPSAIPNYPGIIFPYFHGMIVADKTSLVDLFLRNFKATLGDNTDAVLDGIDRLRRDLDCGSGLDIHMELTHLYYMINLALDTQTRLFVVHADTYLGCALLGAKFKIYTGLKWVGPESAVDLQLSASSLFTHTEAVAEIVKLVANAKLVDGAAVTEEDQEKAMESSFHLAEVMSRLDWHDAVVAGKMKKILAHLRFVSYKRESYKQITIQNATWAMRTMNQFDQELEPFPVFLPTGVDELAAVVRERQGRVLAAFGSNTFSIISSSGAKYHLYAPLSSPDRDGRLYESRGVEPSPLIFFSKPLSVVIKELKRLRDGKIESTVVVGIKKVERAVSQRKAHECTDRKLIIPFWNELSKFHFPKVTDGGVQSEKRQLDPFDAAIADDRVAKRMAMMDDDDF